MATLSRYLYQEDMVKISLSVPLSISAESFHTGTLPNAPVTWAATFWQDDRCGGGSCSSPV